MGSRYGWRTRVLYFFWDNHWQTAATVWTRYRCWSEGHHGTINPQHGLECVFCGQKLIPR